MSTDIIALIVAGVASLAALATFFTRASYYLTIREHDIYANSLHSTFVDVDRRLGRIEDKLNGGVWKNTHE